MSLHKPDDRGSLTVMVYVRSYAKKHILENLLGSGGLGLGGILFLAGLSLVDSMLEYDCAKFFWV